jgi:two-component system, LuxR family, response regulator DctR
MISLIEDDDGLSSALKAFFKSKNLQFLHFNSGETYLQDINEREANTPTFKTLEQWNSGVILLDIRLPGISGLEVFEQQKKIIPLSHKPVLFMTGHGDVQLAVSALKMGAYDFLTKPISTETLQLNIEQAYKRSAELLEIRKFILNFELRFNKLTSREGEIAELIALNNTNKIIANSLGISVRTIELHRSRIFEKMEVSSAAELAAKFEKIGYSRKIFLNVSD